MNPTSLLPGDSCARSFTWRRAAGGESRKRVVLEDMELWPGSWKNPVTGKPVRDTSTKYTVIIEREKADTVLPGVLERAANSFDQEEILFLVQGIDRSVKRDPDKGFLKGDPAGG